MAFLRSTNSPTGQRASDGCPLTPLAPAIAAPANPADPARRVDPAPRVDPVDPVVDPTPAPGAFQQALRTAITGSGLSLDRVQDRLRRRGTSISIATLSTWQSGRSQPERPHSLAALSLLEEELGLRPDALRVLLGPPRPRGRWLRDAAPAAGLADAWSGRGIEGALNQVDSRWDQELTRISCHTRLELDVQGRECITRIRNIVRAECDGPDRFISICQLDAPGPLPQLHVPAPFRTGRVVAAPAQRLLVAEVLFERPIARGETVIVEYALHHTAPRPHSTQLECTLHVPVREYVLEVRFDPAAIPTSCHSFRSAELDSRRHERLLRPDAIGSVHAVALAARPCHFGIRWDWG